MLEKSRFATEIASFSKEEIVTGALVKIQWERFERETNLMIANCSVSSIQLVMQVSEAVLLLVRALHTIAILACLSPQTVKKHSARISDCGAD